MPASTEPTPRLSWWRRHFGRGTGTILLSVLAVLWALLALLASARAFVAAAFVLSFWGGMLLMVVLLGMVIGGLRMREWNAAVIVVPAIMLAGLLIASTPLPLLARFTVSAPGFSGAVEKAGPPPPPAAGDVVAAPTQDLPTAWYGLYRVVGPQPVPGGYLFHDADAWTGTDSGIAYLPDGPPAASAGRFTGLWGPWYAWTGAR